MPCRSHWLQLQQHQEELEELDVEVAVVTFEAMAAARDYVKRNDLDWPLLVDADRAVYALFGMGRAGWWVLLKPRTLWKYFQLWRSGTRPQAVGSDVHQLGGDVVIDPDGRLKMKYVSEEPHDRPSIEALLSVFRGTERATASR